MYDGVLPASAYQPEVLGPFWSQVFSNQRLLRALLKARASVERQTEVDVQIGVHCLNRRTVPWFHVELYYPIILETDASQTRQFALPRYDESYLYGDPIEIAYDTPVMRTWTAWPVPADILEIPLLTYGVEDIRACWVDGIDYVLKDGFLCFRDNPFRRWPELSRLVVWGRHVKIRKPYVRNYFGVLVDSADIATAGYRNAINVVLDAWSIGTTEGDLADLVAAVLDIPQAQADGEQVQAIDTDARGAWIVTDRQAALVPSAAYAAVSVGQTLKKGQLLSTAVRIFDTSDRRLPSATVLPYVKLSPEILDHRITSTLTFANATLPTTVFVDMDGWTLVEFPVGGPPADVARFWQFLHQREKALNLTLACLLTGRSSVTMQPTPAEVPTTVNPAELIWEHWLLDRTAVLHVDENGFGAGSLGLDFLRRLLRQIVPPTTLVLLQS